MLFSTQAIKYFSGLRKPDLKFSGVEIINPYERDDVKEIVKKFYSYCAKLD